MKPEKLCYCSFCGKTQHEVRKMFAQNDKYICNLCVDRARLLIRHGNHKAKVIPITAPVLVAGPKVPC